MEYYSLCTRIKCIEVFKNMEKYWTFLGDQYRSRAYKNAWLSLTSKLPITDGMKEKIKLIEKGKFDEDKKLKDLTLLSDIPGFGRAKINKIIMENPKISATKIIQILKKDKSLTSYQKIGLKYYKYIYRNLDRRIVDDIVDALLDKIPESSYKSVTVAGSYRRGRKIGIGDIDMIIEDGIIDNVINAIKSIKTDTVEFKETFAIGKEKFSFLVKYKNPRKKCRLEHDPKVLYTDEELYDYYYIQVDIRFTTTEKYPSMILYFTGSKDFNIMMRREAIKKGLILNEYGLFKDNGKERIVLEDEKDIIEYLGLDHKYFDPINRDL